MPLRQTVTTDGLGESFAMPKRSSSLAEMERALTVLVHREGSRDIYARLAERAGVRLAPAEVWLLARLGETHPTSLASLGQRLQVDPARLVAPLDSLVRGGFVRPRQGSPDGPALLELTPTGQETLDRLIAARRQGLAELAPAGRPNNTRSWRAS